MPRKITIFEPHFHDAQFGPTVHHAAEDTAPAEEPSPDEPASPGVASKLKVVLLGAVVAALGLAAYRRFGGDGGLEIEIEELDAEEATASQ